MKKTNYPKMAISGGLGNQLFQWSAAHYLFGSEGFCVDLTHYYLKTKRKFELGPLIKLCQHNHNQKLTLNRITVMRLFEWSAHHGTSVRLLEHLGYFQEGNHIKELSEVIKQHKKRNSPLYLNGIFQNGDFVDQTSRTVKKELTDAVANSFIEIRDKHKIPERYAVIHVRRGDYPISSFPSEAIGQLDDKFYLELATKTDLPIVLLTENALDVGELVSRLKPRLLLTQRETNPWQSLAIMARSEFLIGSNSTLSWWGAYLASKLNNETWLPMEWSQWGNYQEIQRKSETILFSPSVWRQNNF